MRRFWKIALLVALPAAFIGLLLMVPHYRARHAVDRYRRSLEAQGEKLRVGDWVPPIPPLASNAAPELIEVARQMSAINSQLLPAPMRCTGPGRARVVWKQPVLSTREATNLWPELEAAVELARPRLAAVRAALEKPALQFDVNYEQLQGLQLQHLSDLRSAGWTLEGSALCQLHQGNVEEAWANLRAFAVLVKLYHEEPLLISQLIRCGMIGMGTSTTWEALQYPSWSEAQLADLQNLWAGIDLIEELPRCFAMERAMIAPQFARLRESRAEYQSLFLGGTNLPSLADFAEDSRAALRQLRGQTAGYWAWKWYGSYREELLTLQAWQIGLEAVRRIQTTKVFRPAQQFVETALPSSTPASEDLPAFGLSQGAGRSIRRFLSHAGAAECQRRLLVTALALTRFHLRHGEYPTALNALVPDFMAEVPRDAIDGQPLRYRLRPDGAFLLYSIGEDGVDHGGDATPAKPGEPPRNWNGRDWVWPEPASPEEVTAAERKK